MAISPESTDTSTSLDLQEFRSCCEQGEFDQATTLLLKGNISDLNTGWGDRKFTPIHWACRHGNLDFVKLLFETFQADPEVTLDGEYNETPLHIAAVEGHLDILKYLTTKAKCNPDIRDRSGYDRSPITYACGYADFPPHYSPNDKAVEVISYLYNSCLCDPNRQDEWGMTALHNACANRRPALVRYLVLECKCDTAVCDFQGDTSLHFACLELDYVPGRDNMESDAVEIIKFLIEEQNCDPNVTNKMNQTPCYYAYNQPRLFAKLFEYGGYH